MLSCRIRGVRGCGGWFGVDSSYSLKRRPELRFASLLKPQPWRWVKWGSASWLQYVHRKGFYYSVYEYCVFLYPEMIGLSVLADVPQLSLKQPWSHWQQLQKPHPSPMGIFLNVLGLQWTYIN